MVAASADACARARSAKAERVAGIASEALPDAALGPPAAASSISPRARSDSTFSNAIPIKSAKDVFDAFLFSAETRLRASFVSLRFAANCLLISVRRCRRAASSFSVAVMACLVLRLLGAAAAGGGTGGCSPGARGAADASCESESACGGLRLRLRGDAIGGVKTLFSTGGGGAMVLPEPERQRVRGQAFAGTETKDGANSAVGDRA